MVRRIVHSWNLADLAVEFANVVLKGVLRCDAIPV